MGLTTMMQTEASGLDLDTSLHRELSSRVEDAWSLIPPCWTLRNFVAVNPYMGLSGRPFVEAVREVDRLFHARSMMPEAYYREKYRRGEIEERDLGRAADELARARSAEAADPAQTPAVIPSRFRTYAEAVDARTGSQWAAIITDEVAKWCAARFDTGQSAWHLPWQELGMYAAWREAASIDRNPELRGFEGFRSYAASLPADPRLALQQVLSQLQIPDHSVTDFFARCLASVGGWSGHVRYLVREARMQGRDDDDLHTKFLALRIAYEGALQASLGGSRARGDAPSATAWSEVTGSSPEAPRGSEDLNSGLLWQHAFEAGFRRRLFAKLRTGADGQVLHPRLQAAFCIDVRSEVYRRHLESVSQRVQTIGFAGFFGIPIEWIPLGAEHGVARCPVLICPSFRIRETVSPAAEATHDDAIRIIKNERTRHRAFLSARLSTVSSFSIAETVGTWFGIRILTDSVRATHPRSDGAFFPSKLEGKLRPSLDSIGEGSGRTGLNSEERVAIAESVLRGMGLVEGFAEVVVLAGHGSRTANNPYGSGLDCGACGGHPGDGNAQVAAAVLNDAEVREALVRRGIRIPEATHFIAGFHETTTDEVHLYGAERLPEGLHAEVAAWFAEATARTQRERLGGLTRGQSDGVEASDEVRRRSRDWSEVRPEWGLARNGAFIAARRSHTRGLNLDGRTFLHDYDIDKDPERKLLEVIMTAPMVVATWINLQYYASTVDNAVFGSGNKVLHNVVGRHSVIQGNRSDLMVGLPLQSVHDGHEFHHEPIRLQVVIEAPPDDLDQVLEAHPTVRELVDHGWLHLISWSPGSGEFRRRAPDGTWIREVD